MLTNLAYMVACVLFIVGIKKLTKAQTARQGNFLSALGMLIAVVAVFVEVEAPNGLLWAFAAIAIGSVIGIVWAKKVQMTGMPELVALFNGFGGLASLLVAVSEFYSRPPEGAWMGVAIGLTILIGAVTFTGSMVAWAKLAEKIRGDSRAFKGQKIVNLGILLLSVAAIVVLTLPALGLDAQLGTWGLVAVTGLALLLGFTLVMPIGGGDMPVVISLLNSFSGLAAAMAGFIIANTVLIVAGCLVGASGVVLTLIMCKAMNRSIGNLLFGGFGAAGASQKGAGAEPKSVSAEDAYLVLEAAQSVVVIPGYGMAVAQAQHVVKELSAKLEANGAEVSFAVHPVAGRMPGHMNVLLAEADIPYEQLKTMDEINPTMPVQDVAIVIGANDVVNPAAETDPASPIYGMPIIKAYEAKTVFVLKRGKGKGFSGIENELFCMPNTCMLYGDAKATLATLAGEFAND